MCILNIPQCNIASWFANYSYKRRAKIKSTQVPISTCVHRIAFYIIKLRFTATSTTRAPILYIIIISWTFSIVLSHTMTLHNHRALMTFQLTFLKWQHDKLNVNCKIIVKCVFFSYITRAARRVCVHIKCYLLRSVVHKKAIVRALCHWCGMWCSVLNMRASFNTKSQSSSSYERNCKRSIIKFGTKRTDGQKME